MDSAEARVYRMSNFGEDKDDCLVLVHHKQARNVINMANSYLDSGRYELVDIQICRNMNEDEFRNSAVLKLNRYEMDGIAHQNRINRLVENGLCIECGKPVPQDGGIWETCKDCQHTGGRYDGE